MDIMRLDFGDRLGFQPNIHNLEWCEIKQII